jgi:type IV pilus assembly protein PilN
MPNINLLPWRQEARLRRNKEFLTLAVLSVIFMLGIVALVHLQFIQWIDYQQRRNDFLQGQINKLDEKIKEIAVLEDKKKRLEARMDIIRKLQASRPEVVHLFNQLVATLPEGVYYRKLEQKDLLLNLEGFAQSNARVSTLMRNIGNSQWLEQPKLEEIKAESKGTDLAKLYAFKLVVPQTVTVKPDDQQEKAM